MEKTKRTIVALVAVVSLIGIVPSPVQAVDPDCNATYSIPDSEPLLARSLLVSSSETGSIDVSSTDDITVKVKLVSDGSILNFGVFVKDPDCEAAGASTSTHCGDHEELDTVNNDPPQEKTCKLDPPTSGTMTYYFRFVNNGSNTASYKAWEV